MHREISRGALLQGDTIMNLTIKRLKENAVFPQRAAEGSAGYDLFACIEESVIIKPHEIVKIPTGISAALEDNSAVILNLCKERFGFQSRDYISELRRSR